MNVLELHNMAPSHDPVPSETLETSYYIATTRGEQAASQAMQYGVRLETIIFDAVQSERRTAAKDEIRAGGE